MTTFPLTQLLASIGDPEGTRTITSIIALLVAIGLALILLAVWIFRTTRPDPELLAPLEAMGERSWRRGDPVWQRRRLDELRPPGARPLAPSVAPPELDESFDAGPTAFGFDDLRASESAPSDGQSSTAATTGGGAETPVLPLDSTPAGAVGPTLDELPDDDFDEDALAVAREELERELTSPADDRSRDWQLDLFERDQKA